MKRIALFLLWLVGAVFGLCAQSVPCGTPKHAPNLQTRTLTNVRTLREAPATAARDVQYIPITFHLIANGAGEGRVELTNVLELLCYVNQEFTNAEMRFYVHRINEIDNNGAYQTPTSAAAFLQAQRDPISVNVYITNTADSNSGIGLTLGYYSSQFDYIVIRKDQVSAVNNTAVHELGHFFSLLHPFNGWESMPFTGTGCAPAISPDGVPTELQDGSNCETAGDFVCDTPPDYNFGLGWPDCNYDASTPTGIRDPDCMELDPDELLHMGYFLNCPFEDYYFTPDQNDLMNVDLASPERDYLDTNFTPFTGAFVPTTLVSPADAAFIDSYNHVELDWEPVDGADFYLLRVGKFASLSNSRAILVYGTSRVLFDLDPSETYYWNVLPLLADDPCPTISGETRRFDTGTITATRAVTALTDWTVHPNPATAGIAIRVDLETATAFRGHAELIDVTGCVAWQVKPRQFLPGKTSLSIPTDELHVGIYLLTLRAGERVSRQRIIVR